MSVVEYSGDRIRWRLRRVHQVLAEHEAMGGERGAHPLAKLPSRLLCLEGSLDVGDRNGPLVVVMPVEDHRSHERHKEQVKEMMNIRLQMDGREAVVV